MFRKMMVFMMIFCIVFVSVSHAEELYPGNEDFDVNQMTKENVINLDIHFLGNLIGESVGKPVTNRFAEGFSGEVPFYGIYDGYAYAPCHGQIYKISIDRFESIEPVGNEYEIVGAYRTTCLNLSWERSHNIQLSMKAISGTVIDSGEIFDFNDTNGPLTKEAGYEPCYITEGHLIYSEYGGGVSQISSTLYAAILHNPNLEVIERATHGNSVLYLPDDMDASIYGGKNLRFVNRYPFSVTIDVIATDTHIVVILRRTEEPTLAS